MIRRILCVGVAWMGLAAGAAAQTTIVEYVHTDALGSPVAITDAAGVVVERPVYEPYGAPIAHGPTDGPGFTGHVEDSATDLDYMQQRYYEPDLARFLSVDPIEAGEDGSDFNRYAYAYGDPYGFSDPDGMQPEGQKAPPVEPPPQPDVPTLQQVIAVPPALPVGPRPVELPEIQVTPNIQLIGPIVGDLVLTYGPRLGPGLLFVAPHPCGGARCGEMPADQTLMLSKGGPQRIRDSGLVGVPPEEIARRLRDPSTSKKEKKRLQKEEKAQGMRNKQKRKK